MNRIFAIMAFAIAWCVSAQIAMACSPPDSRRETETGEASSIKPAKNVPKGAIQLKVKVPNYDGTTDLTDKGLYTGKMSLQVIELLNGKFEKSHIIFNFQNVNNCHNYFTPYHNGFFITAFPMEYLDGDPVLDINNNQEYGAIFYKSPSYDDFEYDDASDDRKINEFSKYKPMGKDDFYFGNPENFHCLDKSLYDDRNSLVEAWRRCVSRDEYLYLKCEPKVAGKLICNEADSFAGQRPLELRRDYNVWLHHHVPLAAILLALGLLMGLGYFFHMTTPRRS